MSMKAAVIRTANNHERLSLHLYPTEKAAKNSEYYAALKPNFYKEKPAETNCHDFVLWQNSVRLDSVSVPESVEVVFVQTGMFEIESE